MRVVALCAQNGAPGRHGHETHQIHVHEGRTPNLAVFLVHDALLGERNPEVREVYVEDVRLTLLNLPILDF